MCFLYVFYCSLLCFWYNLLLFSFYLFYHNTHTYLIYISFRIARVCYSVITVIKHWIPHWILNANLNSNYQNTTRIMFPGSKNIYKVSFFYSGDKLIFSDQRRRPSWIMIPDVNSAMVSEQHLGAFSCLGDRWLNLGCFTWRHQFVYWDLQQLQD